MNRLQPDGGGDILVVMVDISDRMAQEEALDARNLEFRILAEKVGVAVFRTDANGCFTFRNERFAALVDGAMHAVCVPDLIHPDSRAQVARELEEMMASATGASLEWQTDFLAFDGRTILHVNWSASGDAASTDRSYVGSITDVTATVQLKARAETDALTGVLNRHSLEDHVAEAVRSDPDGTLLVFIDVDGFKAVNDTHGHAAGDVVLRTIAERIRCTVRPSDVVGRYGGDEFVIVCRNLNQSEQAANTIVHRVSEAVHPLIVWDGGSWQPAVSMGMARPRRGESPAQVLERADIAMYAAKAERRHPLALVVP